MPTTSLQKYKGKKKKSQPTLAFKNFLIVQKKKINFFGLKKQEKKLIKAATDCLCITAPQWLKNERRKR